MTKSDKLLELRKLIKQKKPEFIRQDAHKKVKLKAVWRRPKGSDSKMRLRLKGYSRSAETGWGSPSEVKHLHASGLHPIVVHNTSQLNDVDAETQGIIIAASVGTKKRVSIVSEALKKNLSILNIKDAKKFLEDVEARLKEKAEEKQKQKKEKEKKEKEKKEKAAAKEKEEEKAEAKDELAEKIEDEERKKTEKEEKDKVLTRKK